MKILNSNLNSCNAYTSPDEVKEQKKAYRINNKEKIKEKRKEYNLCNP
jgi:hypothetical protein